MTKQSEARERVLDLIDRLGVGDAIPSERQLSADLGVSRLTVRAALDELVREGYLVRRRGSGTFVSEPKIAQEPTVTNEEESEALGVPLHSPAFLFERTTRSERGEIVEFVRSIYRGDRYRLVTELARGREPRRLALTLSPDASSARH